MLDNGDGRALELGDQLDSGVGVGEVVIAEFLPWSWRAVATPGRVLPSRIERGFLMRVLAIAHALLQGARHGESGRAGSRHAGRRTSGDGRVVGRGAA